MMFYYVKNQQQEKFFITVPHMEPVSNGMESRAVLEGAMKRHKAAVEATESVIENAARGGEIIVETLKAGKKVFACGNGGSAADAEHFIGELLCRYKDDRQPFPGISLVSQAGALTAIGNDYAYEDVFARQLRALGGEGDLLIGISTSGKSKNVLAALRVAQEKKMRSILLTGPGGAAAEADRVSPERSIAKADVVVAVPVEETARIQEMHLLIYHSWCEFLDMNLK